VEENFVGCVVGWLVGCEVGCMVEIKVGVLVGCAEGCAVGSLVGSREDALVGRAVGCALGWLDGNADGRALGCTLGGLVGELEGVLEGKTVGAAVGVELGCKVGSDVGRLVGSESSAAKVLRKVFTWPLGTCVAALTRRELCTPIEVCSQSNTNKSVLNTPIEDDRTTMPRNLHSAWKTCSGKHIPLASTMQRSNKQHISLFMSAYHAYYCYNEVKSTCLPDSSMVA
jgi:hypothetical protein